VEYFDTDVIPQLNVMNVAADADDNACTFMTSDER
jgi:hypothetical protein